VPQGIDAADFDPNKHQPLTLRDLPDARMLTGTAHNASLATQPFGKCDQHMSLVRPAMLFVNEKSEECVCVSTSWWAARD